MKQKYFIGVDVGGTKISAGLVTTAGSILSQEKTATPKKAGPDEIFSTLVNLINEVLAQNKIKPSQLSGIGLGIPGIVNSDKGTILNTPNIDLSNYPLVKKLHKKFPIRIAIGNDVNLGTLGEKWLGAGKNAKNIIGLFPGTGVGGAIIIDGKLYSGAHGAAAELGHMTMDMNGPKCTCGNKGCFEAMASRWAMERDIRAAIKKGEKSIITELNHGKLNTIKSKVLKKALKNDDPLTKKLIKRASQTIGLACINLRHIFDPELFIFGGGLIDACGKFMLPIIEKTINADPFFSGLCEYSVEQSQLGDDAVILGAVALIKQQLS